MGQPQNAKCSCMSLIDRIKTDCIQYLGPSAGQLVHFFVLTMVNSMTVFMLSVMLIRTLWGLGENVTTIESWEIARHRKLLHRARIFGGYLDGPDGIKVKIEKQEFPYDIGIWANMKQGMDGGNFVAWFWPFARTPSSGGLAFEVNGFEDPSRSWPPPDPDRIPRLPRSFGNNQAFTYQQTPLSDYDEIQTFKERQLDDLKRRQSNYDIIRRKPFHERHAKPLRTERSHSNKDNDSSDGQSGSGEEGWRNTEGDRLRDYGVDEDAEFYDQDDIPLSELLRRRHRSNQAQ
jgi:palmitoyltransferase